MDLGIAPTAKLTVVYVVVLFYMVTKQSNVTNARLNIATTEQKIIISKIREKNPTLKPSYVVFLVYV